MNGNLEWNQLMELIKMKRDKPEEYKQLLKDMVEIMKDIQEAVANSLEKNLK